MKMFLFFFRLKNIHDANFIHRDFHSGNILLGVESFPFISQQCCVGDLGLSQPAGETSFNNEIYGVIPYVAPEIFNGAVFTKASDVYSLGIIMWECTTGCKPFADIVHDFELIYNIINGKRPEITKDTPENFANLMKKCWEFDPTKRPSIHEVCETLNDLINLKNNAEQFDQAEERRLKLIQLKSLGPNFTEKHPKAIFTSRPLKSFISKASSIKSINSTSSISFNGAIYTSGPLSALISTVNVSRKHKIEELDIEIQDSVKGKKKTKRK
ncbi:kinase-like domain-containing protein [Glomus cerebriforme]|uniref:Kinase-like domain-containing protein n=1 Tax=Glomus cerebriforme TaxID=658196 RepID=A0A397S317_9GLOM|nr:kinase-like domain-containing protein [Glomus cerebriforme]